MKTWEEYAMEELDRKKAKAETAKDNDKDKECLSISRMILDMLEQFADALEEDDDNEEEADEAETEVTPKKAEDTWQKTIDNHEGDLFLNISIDGIDQYIKINNTSWIDVALCDKEGRLYPYTLLHYDINR